MTYWYPDSWPPGDYPGRAKDGVLVMNSADAAKVVRKFNEGRFTGLVVNGEHGARGLTDLAFVLDMDPAKLLHLNVLAYGITDDRAVERLTGLVSLHLDTGARSRLRLEGHWRLTDLGLDGERVPRAGLAHLPLKNMFLMNYQAPDWTGLPPSLQYAKVIWRRLETLDGLDRLDLRLLILAYARRILDWSLLATQSGLRYLELSSVPVRELSWLSGLTRLRSLTLENCGALTGWPELVHASSTLDRLNTASWSVHGKTTITDAPSSDAAARLCDEVAHRGRRQGRTG